MAYTKAEVKAFAAAFSERLISVSGRPCPVCGKEDQWKIGASIIALLTSDNTKDLPDPDKRDKFYPVLPFYCSNCGNTHLLNVQVLGLNIEDTNDGE